MYLSLSQTLLYNCLFLVSVYKFPEPCSLPPANKVCEGYVFTGVCLFTGGGCLPHCMLGPEADTPPPWADISPPHAVHAGRCGRYASYWNAYLLTNISLYEGSYCGVFTLPDTDSDSDSKPNGYIVLCRNLTLHKPGL